MWQTVEKKARFIGQIKTGDLDARTAEDLGSDELGNSAAATKAVAAMRGATSTMWPGCCWAPGS